MGKLKIPAPTDWLELKEVPPPKDTWLLLYGIPFPELEGTEKEEWMEQGFCSGRTGIMLGTDGESLSDMFEITHYHVIHDPTGKTRKVETYYR